MFDKLRQSIGVPPGQSQIQQPNKPPVTLISHIVHLAAAPPDGSPHPVWNANSKFDQLMWASLPDEFKQVRSPSSLAFRLSHSCPQRQINYSIVTIRPIPRFKEIFQSVRIFAHFFNVVSLTVLKTNSTDATTPWFDVAPNHTVMLSGFPPKGSCIPNHPQRSLTPRSQASSGRPKPLLLPQTPNGLVRIQPPNLRPVHLLASLLLAQNLRPLRPTPLPFPIPHLSRVCLQLSNKSLWKNTSNFNQRSSERGLSYKRLRPMASPRKSSFP